jgi:hypothetical protein
MNDSLFSWVLDAATYTLAIVCVFDGVLRISSFGMSKKVIIPTIFGILFLVGHAAMSYTTHSMQLKLASTMQNLVVSTKLVPDWGVDLPSAKRTEISLVYARMAFRSHGRLDYYFDHSGKRQLFAPSQVDLDEREQNISQAAVLNYSANERLESAKWLLIVAFFAALFGYVWSRESQLTWRSSGTPQKRGAP